jgi:hypothetical protein
LFLQKIKGIVIPIFILSENLKIKRGLIHRIAPYLLLAVSADFAADYFFLAAEWQAVVRIVCRVAFVIAVRAEDLYSVMTNSKSVGAGSTVQLLAYRTRWLRPCHHSCEGPGKFVVGFGYFDHFSFLPPFLLPLLSGHVPPYSAGIIPLR